MWITLLVMAVAISLEPFRISMTVLLINRPRPLLQLLAFLVGGFAMGTAVGLIVLFVLRPALGSAHFTLPRVQIVIGALALVAAVVVATGILRGGTGQATVINANWQRAAKGLGQLASADSRSGVAECRRRGNR